MAEQSEIKRALALLTYGVYVITTPGDGARGAYLTPWLSQVSLQPPALGFSVAGDEPVTEDLQPGALFLVNVLRAGQKELAERFVGDSGSNGESAHLDTAPNGCKFVPEALATIECRLSATLETGKHFRLYVGEVTDASVLRDGQPLTLRQTGLDPLGLS